MTRRLLFRSKSCGVAADDSPPPSFYNYDDGGGGEDENDEEDYSPATTPFIATGAEQHRQRRWRARDDRGGGGDNSSQFQIVDVVVAVLRKSLVTCTTVVEDEEEDGRGGGGDGEVEIGWPTDVRHVSHVTFDRFNGFLGLPVELQPQLPSKVPSASASVFGVSANSMQCSYDERGNSVPTILLMMQQHLYSEGGLQAEGIFRINAENSQEEYVRSQLNTGVVPHGIDVHCLAGLIKAWFRELPTGVLDSLSPEQVMHCNSEDDCTQLVKLLPPTEAALLDWAINLMADVAHHESHNKMNARNIAMVFAPNMTKMADPLTALIHAVQVMNLLKTLIVKSLGYREEMPSSTNSYHGKNTTASNTGSQPSKVLPVFSRQQTFECCPNEGAKIKNLFSSATLNRLESDGMEEAWSFQSIRESQVDFHDSISLQKTPVMENSRQNLENGVKSGYSGGGEAGEGIFERLNLKKGVRKLYRHPVFQLSRPVKKSGGVAIV